MILTSEMTYKMTKDLIKVIKDAGQPVPQDIENLKTFAEDKRKKMSNNNFRVKHYNSNFSHRRNSGYSRTYRGNDDYGYNRRPDAKKSFKSLFDNI